ncbi:MAG: hypothetical protein ACJAVN_000693 [Roseivirga sp.]|jgi:hypothetical protein
MNNRHNTTSLVKLILILTPFFLLSCGGKPEATETESGPRNGLQSYKLDLKEDKIPVADLIQSIEITRLEETEESLLRAVSQVHFHEDKMIILSNEAFHIYSKTGEFLSKFNRKGDGPEEYSRLTDVWLENGIIGVHNFGKSVNRYDLEGTFVSRDRIDKRVAHLHPYKSGYVLDRNIRGTQDSLEFFLVTLDDQMKLDKTFLPFDKFSGFQFSFDRSSFLTLDDDLFYLRNMSDTVYRITTDSVVPFIHYDFQEDWYFKPGVEVKRDFSEEQQRKKQVWFVLNHIGQDYIFLYTTLGPRMDYDFFIDRETKQSISIDWRISTNEKLDFYAIDWNGDEFLISLRSSQLNDLLDQFDQEQYSFTEGTTLEEIESSENPVLVRMKLRDFPKVKR